MARRIEPLDRGLVTNRDPGLLKPGELSFVRNAVYRPGSRALQRATGRVAFGTATASALDVDGLRDVTFDNAAHYIVAHVSTAYVTATVGDTGTFGVFVSGLGDGSQLEVAHYRNRWYLFNGFQADASGLPSNKVMYLSATSATVPSSRQHSMLPVTSPPTPTATAAGTFSQTVTGYYEYWYTEVFRHTQDLSETFIEGTFAGSPATVFVTALGMVPVLPMPAPANPVITHWRLYRSPKKDKESDKKFPTGFLIAEVATSTSVTSVADSFTASSTGPKIATLVNTGSFYNDFSNAATLTSTGSGSFASAVGTVISPKSQGIYSYNFGGFAGSIQGIEVVATASANAPFHLSVRLGLRQSSGSFIPDLSAFPPWARGQVGQQILDARTAVKSTLVTGTSAQVVRLGGPTDRWFTDAQYPITDTWFSPDFMTQIGALSLGGIASAAVDGITVNVYYGGTTDSVTPFPTVAYTFGDVVAQVGKNGPASSASTGDVFEDSLVINDVSNPGVIKFSYPGDPDAFPSTYYLDFETPHNDRVTCIKVVNSRLIVMLRQSIYRVNYLPSERDASFDRGKAIEIISRDLGCVNEMCACTFTQDGGQERLAFVSDQGVYVTDGYTTKCWTDNLDWRGERDGTGIANLVSGNYVPVCLVNDLENLQLVFIFRNPLVGFGGDYFELTFQYNDLIDGIPRVGGMVTMLNTNAGGGTAAPKSAWPITKSDGKTELFLGYGASAGGVSSTAAGAGQVWRETGTTIPSSNPSMQYRTRRMYLAGMGMEWKLGEIYGYCGFVNGFPTVRYTTLNRKTDSFVESSQSKTFVFNSVDGPKLHKVNFQQAVEGVIVSASVTGECDYSQEYLIIDGDNFGKEDSGL